MGFKRGSGRGRGRPRGSRARGPIAVRGRGLLTSAALAAAELAGAQAGKSAALAAYPFLGSALSGSTDDGVVSSYIHKRGRGRGRSKTIMITRTVSAAKSQMLSETPQTSCQSSSSSAHGLGFYIKKQ